MGRQGDEHAAPLTGWRRRLGQAGGLVLATTFIGGVAYNWVISALGIGPDRQLQSYERLVTGAITNEIWCFSYQDWLITAVSGPCKGFKAPPVLMTGQYFEADGRAHSIKTVIATFVDKVRPAGDPLEKTREPRMVAAVERLEGAIGNVSRHFYVLTRSDRKDVSSLNTYDRP